MHKDLKTRLEVVLSKMVETKSLNTHEMSFLRARSSYLTAEQVKQLNKLMKGVEGMKQVKKAHLQKIESEPVTVQVEETIKPSDDKDEDTSDGEDKPEDDGDLEIIDDSTDEEGNEDSDGDLSDDEFDLDSMNLEQLKSVAKDFKVKGFTLYKSEEKLRKAILANYETSNEGLDKESELI